MSDIFWLEPNNPVDQFPNVELALIEPNGLLAAGGDLQPERLINAYKQGIFPWYSEGEPILWWSPDPRSILIPHDIKVSRSLKKTLNRNIFNVTLDCAFADVINACAQPRHYGPGTWLTEPLRASLCQLHELGYAHSVECWFENELVGGLYGLAFGKVFFGESMFSTKSDASKVALVYLARQLARWNFALIDCQVKSNHLTSLGAVDIRRKDFIDLVSKWGHTNEHHGKWCIDNENSTTR